MLARPTLLESTVLVFAFGNGDVFGTRVTPSQAFDVLGKGFSKIQLTLTVVALGVGVLILSPMVSFLPLFSLSFRLRFYTFIFIKFIKWIMLTSLQVKKKQMNAMWKAGS